MAQQISYLIIGNGIAGVTAAETLRAANAAASIAVIADDPFPVYYRPALKDYLAGRLREDKLWARPTSFYQDRSIYFLSDRVVAIQASQRLVQLQSGKHVGYRRLLLASGAHAATLSCPGLDLQGITTLRTVADYQAILQQLAQVRRVVVCGSGTLALETIETLRHRGLSVTHLLRKRTLWSEVLDATASDLVLLQEQRDGIDVRLEEEVAEISGRRGHINGVVTSSGQHIPCELLIIAIGIEPAIDFIKASGLNCGIGVRVDTAMRTSAPDIYAAGDVLETTHPLTRRTRAVGQWYPAIQQARAAAYSMLDQLDLDRPFQASTFYNATFLYGFDFASVGLTTVSGSGYRELVDRPQPRTYRKVIFKDGVPIGALALGERAQIMALKRAIDHRVDLQPVASRLFANDFDLDTWLTDQGVPPPLLNARCLEGRPGEKSARPAAQAVPVPAAMPEQRFEARLIHEPDRVTDLNFPAMPLPQKGVVRVGRQPGVHVLIDQGTVSRLHAEISYVNDQYVLQDLGSSNGTFVNDTRLEPHRLYRLEANDLLRFGKLVKFKFTVRMLKSGGSPSQAGMTRLQDLNSEPQPVLSGQPLLNADGSLLLPGASVSTSSSEVASFRHTPGLLILSGASDGAAKRQPVVYMLREGHHATLGRDKANDIPLPDVAVSRRHAEIFPGPEGFYVRDLGSSNGVSVNQAKIDNPYLLSHGDRILLGGSVIFFIDLRTNWQPTESVPAPAPVAVGAVQEVTRKVQAAREDATVPRMIICPQCGKANMHIARFCAGCSTPLSSGVR